MELIERVSTLSEKFYSIEEINYDADIEKTLLGLVSPVKTLTVRQASSAVVGVCVSIGKTVAEETGCAFAGRADQPPRYRVHPVVGRFSDR